MDIVTVVASSKIRCFPCLTISEFTKTCSDEDEIFFSGFITINSKGKPFRSCDLKFSWKLVFILDDNGDIKHEEIPFVFRKRESGEGVISLFVLDNEIKTNKDLIDNDGQISCSENLSYAFGSFHIVSEYPKLNGKIIQTTLNHCFI